MLQAPACAAPCAPPPCLCSHPAPAPCGCPARAPVGAEEDPQWEFSGRKVKVNKKILKIRGMLTKLRQAASSEWRGGFGGRAGWPLNPMMCSSSSVAASFLPLLRTAARRHASTTPPRACALVPPCAGGLKQDTGEEEYDAGRGCYIKLKHWYQSKVGCCLGQPPGSRYRRHRSWRGQLPKGTRCQDLGCQIPMPAPRPLPSARPSPPSLGPGSVPDPTFTPLPPLPHLTAPHTHTLPHAHPHRHCHRRPPALPPLAQAEAVIEVLEGKDPEEKVLVFSEFPATLQAIKALLPSIGLQSRNLIGSSSAGEAGVWVCGRGSRGRGWAADCALGGLQRGGCGCPA